MRGNVRTSFRGVFTIKDLRDFISKLERSAELLRIKHQVDWKYEIGEITRKVKASDSKGHALLFENIKDYPGFNIFTNGLGSYSRIALALCLEPLTPVKDIVKVFKQRILEPVKSVMVKDSTFKENIFIGNSVDLTKLPVPWWNREDVGRYIGTWHLNITKDPETGIRNVGIYRMQFLNSNTTAISISPKSHLAIHLSKSERMGKPLEMGVAIGVDEALIMCAAAAVPFGVDEFNVAGGLRQRPVELIKCNTVDIEVPAHSEIVLEGKILPKVRVKEGPFLDYAGIPKSNPQAPIFEVTGMMYRNNPFFRGAVIGNAGAEDHLLYSFLSKADCLDFHGSRIRQKIQNALLKKSLFTAFQFMGRLRQLLKDLRI